MSCVLILADMRSSFCAKKCVIFDDVKAATLGFCYCFVEVFFFSVLLLVHFFFFLFFFLLFFLIFRFFMLHYISDNQNIWYNCQKSMQENS